MTLSLQTMSGWVLACGLVVAQVGENSELRSGVRLYHNTVLGSEVLVHANTVIGSDGFGFAPVADGWEKILQLGRVVVGDRVEIGANCAIDRGALDDTVIEDDVIIDNLVHIAHGVRIGRQSAVAGQVGFAGGAVLGERCTVGGQAGFAGHITIAMTCMLVVRVVWLAALRSRGTTHRVRR